MRYLNLNVSGKQHKVNCFRSGRILLPALKGNLIDWDCHEVHDRDNEHFLMRIYYYPG